LDLVNYAKKSATEESVKLAAVEASKPVDDKAEAKAEVIMPASQPAVETPKEEVRQSLLLHLC